MQHRRVLRGSPVGVDRHLGCPHLRRHSQRRLYLLELHCSCVGELIARLDRLHLPLRALRVLLQGGEQSSVARLLALLQSECHAERVDTVADSLLPGGQLPGDVSQVGHLARISGGRLQPGHDRTGVAGEQRRAIRQVLDLHYVALDLAPQLLR
jgi:hypothetical protein